MSVSQIGEASTDKIIECEFDVTEEGYVSSLKSFKSKPLDCEPLTHNKIWLSMLVTGGCSEKWSALTKNELPGDSCDLVVSGKCEISLLDLLGVLYVMAYTFLLIG